MIMITLYGAQYFSTNTSVIINLAAALFVLPFFLFSATAGQIADKYEKSLIIRRVKFFEIVIMLGGSLAFWTGNLYLLFGILFLLGTHSVFFGPLKYSILPQHLNDNELVGGNAQVEMGTFAAILIGTIGGGLLAGTEQAAFYLPIVMLTVASLGYLASRFIPTAPANSPNLQINWNPISETWRTIKMAQENRSIFLSIMGISWFWFLGAAYLTQIPNFANTILAGDNTVITLLLSVFTLGIAMGSLICERLSGHKVEIGLVPFGAIGISLFGIDLFFASQAMPIGSARDFVALLSISSSWRILLDVTLIGFFGGTYIVPLYAMIQQRAEAGSRARVIAVNNIMNAFFMVVSALTGVLLLGVADLTTPQFFLVLALMNIAVCFYIFNQVPEFTMRFLFWMLSHSMYRVKHEGLEHIPDEGAAIIVCNHVSFIDALLLAGAVKRPIRFIMYKPIYDLPVLNFIFRTGKSIPINSQHVNKAAYEKAFCDIEQGLKQGDLLCIFPEGKLTLDGEMSEFKTGIERILNTTPVPVIPMALRGLWGSFFSHKDGKALSRLPRRFWSSIDVVADKALLPEAVTAKLLYEAVHALRGDTKK